MRNPTPTSTTPNSPSTSTEAEHSGTPQAAHAPAATSTPQTLGPTPTQAANNPHAHGADSAAQQQGGILFPMQIAGQSIVQQSWQGPYPPPDAIERYERALPGFFDRIVSMAERMEAAQIEQSASALEHQRQATRHGQDLGFVAAVAALTGALVCAFIGQPIIAGAFLTVPIMSVAIALVNSAKHSPPGSPAPTRSDASTASGASPKEN